MTPCLGTIFLHLYTVLLQEDIYVIQIIIHSTSFYDLVPRRLRAQAHILRHTEYYILGATFTVSGGYPT